MKLVWFGILCFAVNFSSTRTEAQVVVTTAGTGLAGFAGDGGPATSAKLNMPSGVVAAQGGGFIISDRGNSCLRKVNGTTGNITTFAGIGTIPGFSGDGAQATDAHLAYPINIAQAPNGDIVFCDSGNACIRKVELATGIISTVAGNQSLGSGYNGDDGPATAAQISNACAVAVDSFYNIYIADGGNNCLRKVNGTTGVITLIAGTPGSPGFGGDGGPASSAQLRNPSAVAIDSAGNILIADAGNSCLRKVNGTTGNITTIAGIPGTTGASGDLGPATAATLNYPTGLAAGKLNKIFVADRNNQTIRVITSAGTIKTAAGTGTGGFNGDGNSATTQLNAPEGLSLDSAQNCYMADAQNNRIRYVDYRLSVPALTAQNSSLLLTPNPGHQNFNIRLDYPGSLLLKIAVYDFAGRLINTFRGDTNQDIPLELKVGAGVYMVVAESDSRRWERQLVIQ